MVGTSTEMTMSTPPMVGVPAFFVSLVPVFTNVLADLEFAQTTMMDGPMTRPMNIAVMLANAVRKVRY